jgi:hypothetical protein
MARETPWPRLHGGGTQTLGRTCNARLGGVECNEPGMGHVIWWPAPLKHSVFCAAHIGEVTERFERVAVHPLGPDCAMPGAAFCLSQNVCRCDGDGVVGEAEDDTLAAQYTGLERMPS